MRLKKIRPLAALCLLLMIAVMLGGAGSPQDQHSPHSKRPTPIGTIQTPNGPITVYDTSQILSQPNIYVQKHSFSATVSVNK